ncbi:MAG: ribosome biogenesis GTP-binding protein YihA/YsxC [Clostridiales bacterium]|jgi:GTP-binding protein|nr:ribosome biogenesis GTP-binding protein YihA/YsxC [Clostridiales bacterium]
MSLIIKNSEFIKSAAGFGGFLTDGSPQIAVAGRSNVGKSSFINMLLNDGGAARVSSTPGRTALVNYFDVNRGGFILTDLPGYGYAKVAKTERASWGRLVEDYFAVTKNVCVLALVDIRHIPTADDIKLVAYLYAKAIPFFIIANKSDKQSRAQNLKSVKDIAFALKVGVGDIILTSCTKKIGRDDVLAKIESFLK